MNREENLHAGLCRWLRMQHRGVIFNSDMSGVRLHRGLQGKVARLRSTRAMPDLTVYHRNRGWGALLLELKADGARILKKDGTLTANAHIQEQAEVLKMLNSRGYLATFAVGMDEAMAIINWYLENDGIYQNYTKPFPGRQYLKPKGIVYDNQR